MLKGPKTHFRIIFNIGNVRSLGPQQNPLNFGPCSAFEPAMSCTAPSSRFSSHEPRRRGQRPRLVDTAAQPSARVCVWGQRRRRGAAARGGGGEGRRRRGAAAARDGGRGSSPCATNRLHTQETCTEGATAERAREIGALKAKARPKSDAITPG